jgi:hypothetical protein
LDVLPKRFEKYGLNIHPDKTRLVEFRKPRYGGGSDGGSGSFDFLGFTHHWGKTRKGDWAVKRKTSKKRFSRALKTLRDWLRKNRHLRLREQHKTLCQKLVGHFNYYGIRGNITAIANFVDEAKRLWKKWLGRRSQRAVLTWEAMGRKLKNFPLPPPRLKRPRLRLPAATGLI